MDTIFDDLLRKIFLNFKTKTLLKSLIFVSKRWFILSLSAISKLTIERGFHISEMMLQHMNYVTNLTIMSNKNTCKSLGFLSNVTKLTLTKNETTTDLLLMRLTKINNLTLNMNTNITDFSLYYLTQITKLKLLGNHHISDNCLERLTKLKVLDLSGPQTKPNLVQGNSFSCLTCLTDLRLRKNYIITDNKLTILTHLQKLDIRNNYKITGDSIIKLTNLDKLLISKK